MKYLSKFLPWLRTTWLILQNGVLVSLMLILLAGSAVPPGGLDSQVGAYTRSIEFDFGTWTLDAITAKLAGWALNIERFIPPETQSQLVLEYLDQVHQVNLLNAEIFVMYANPEIQDPDTASQPLREALEAEQTVLDSLTPIAEAILQNQLMDVLHDSGLSVLGQVFPPSLYQSVDVPSSLIVSPRTEIMQVLNVSLLPGIKIDAKERLETDIFTQLDHSALVAPIGGIGTYPTMVMQSTNLVWLTEVIAHEWVHNFLTLRPLGINYFTSAELRTINETTADLAGKELGRMILQKYYPDYVPSEPLPHQVDPDLPLPEPDPDTFDFQREMRITRVEVERLLEMGDVEAAEAYMEARRLFLWENGFQIRKLNQAYFAFYGAYNAAPGGGAAGEDPVGPAVVTFRSQFDELADFLNAISWVNSFEQLQQLLSS